MPNSFAKYFPASLRDKPEKLAFFSLAGCISLGLVSIAVSQILLAVTVAGYLWMLRRHKGTVPPGMPIVVPLLAFAIWTIIAALVSSNVLLGLTITKKFFLFLLIFLVPLIVRGEGRLTWIYKAVVAVAVLSSLGGFLQFAADPHRDLLHRITGFMSQWMTYSGLLMLALVILAAYGLCNGLRNHMWVIFATMPICLALIISQTRNAWMGTIAGIGALILLRKPRAIVVLLVAMVALYFASPASIKQRLHSGLDTQDPTTRTRIECFWTSIRMIQDNPWFGVGPKNVSYEALKYRREHEFPDWIYQHMHNNVLQIAAETGIPGLILWLWFMVRLAWDALRCYRDAKARQLSAGEEFGKEALVASAAALGAWIALMVAGMTEFNFGDSEVLTLFLFIASAPYAFMQKRSEVSGSEVSRSNL
jgi:putative inorganic carbon (HCO3(-)) transporter